MGVKKRVFRPWLVGPCVVAGPCVRGRLCRRRDRRKDRRVYLDFWRFQGLQFAQILRGIIPA